MPAVIRYWPESAQAFAI